MISEIKRVVENYINNRQMARIVTGTFTGGRVVLNEKSHVPDSMLSGNLRNALRQGDRVKLLRNDGGGEYFILEITGADVRLQREESDSDADI